MAYCNFLLSKILLKVVKDFILKIKLTQINLKFNIKRNKKQVKLTGMQDPMIRTLHQNHLHTFAVLTFKACHDMLMQLL